MEIITWDYLTYIIEKWFKVSENDLKGLEMTLNDKDLFKISGNEQKKCGHPTDGQTMQPT